MKKINKLKEELKKEILKEIKQEEEKKKKAEEKKQKEVIQPVVIENSKEDLEEIRKKFLLIFLLSGGIVFVAIVLLIINPFDKELSSPKESDKKEEVKEVFDPKKAELHEFEDGIIPNDNVYALQLFNLFEFDKYDYYSFDSTYIYKTNVFEIGNMDINYLIFLATKTEDFNQLIQSQSKELTKIELCEKAGIIKFSSTELEDIVKKNFNTNPVLQNDFVYSYYMNNEFSTKVKFKYSDGYYVSNCQTDLGSANDNVKAKPVLKKIEKSGETITITAQVPILANGKVYYDSSLSVVISESDKIDFLEYINSASTYNYVFINDNNNYKLDKIVRVN